MVRSLEFEANFFFLINKKFYSIKLRVQSLNHNTNTGSKSCKAEFLKHDIST
jgi:hypothetical protein